MCLNPTAVRPLLAYKGVNIWICGERPFTVTLISSFSPKLGGFLNFWNQILTLPLQGRKSFIKGSMKYHYLV